MVYNTSDQQQGKGPRPLTTVEHKAIAAILSQEVPGVAELRAQLDGMRVVRHWTPDGSPSIDMVSSPEAPRSSLDKEIFPVEANVIDESGEYTGELILWLTDGRISSLEYAWITDSMPQSLPLARNFQLSHRSVRW